MRRTALADLAAGGQRVDQLAHARMRLADPSSESGQRIQRQLIDALAASACVISSQKMFDACGELRSRTLPLAEYVALFRG